MVFMKSLLSPHPHARVKRIDTSQSGEVSGRHCDP